MNDSPHLSGLSRQGLASVGFCTLLLLSTACGEETNPGGVADGSSTDPSASDTSGGSSGDTTAVPPPEDTGEASDTTGTPADSCANAEAAVEQFFRAYCAGCHTGSAAQGNFNVADNLEAIIEDGWVVPGDSANSPTYKRIADTSMPPSGAPAYPPDEEIQNLGRFIDECLDDNTPVGCDPNPYIKVDDLLSVILDDLTDADNDDRPFYRYLTITEQSNMGVCGDALKAHAEALSKLVNSLSDQGSLEKPVAIDEHETIFRIDLREYGWDDPILGFDDKWEALVANTPYAFVRLEDEAEDIRTFAQTDVPFLIYEAAADVLTKSPLYDEFANTAATLDELEDLLGIDIDQNIADEDAVRAGLSNSPVSFSQRNRVVERHQVEIANNRVLWLTYDFDNEALAEQNVFQNPVIFDFQLIAAIYSQPNGLHAYAIYDANGNRIDAAPNNILIDPNNLPGNLTVENAISCIGCHPFPFRAAPDEINDFVQGSPEFDAQTKDQVEGLYVSRDEFEEYLEDDNELYRFALRRLGLTESPAVEPVRAGYLDFNNVVTLERAAAELSLTADALRSQLGRLDPALQPLGNGSSVSRDTFTANFINSVIALNIGVAP